MNPSDLPELHQIFETQRARSNEAAFPEWSVRRDRLQRLKSVIIDGEAEIERAIDADFGGRPATETQIAEIFPSLAEIRGALRHGASWMRPRPASVGPWFLPARAEVIPRPLGVVGVIVPWNYPLYLAIGPLVAALAAGNRALVKVSEFTPAFGELFKRLVASHFDASEVAVITGGADVAAAFSSLPFDHILFTGSTGVGRKVMQAAANNLTPVTLELGGKSPVVVTPGYPLAHAVERILTGKLLNAGQTCIAPDYVMLPRAEIEPFIELARQQARRMHPRGLGERDYCSVIDERQYQRLTGVLDEAAGAAVRIEPLFTGEQRIDAGHRLAPALVVEPPMGLRIMREEIFGPLLPVLAYDSVDEAMSRINAQPRPLALYWFDRDSQRTERALRTIPAGGACVNETLLHIAQDALPFGGVGASGMGHYHGQWGFDTFSKLTAVFRQARFNGAGLFTPPYGSFARSLLTLMKRF
ncbi:MAG: coniferyl aldehyde dehydrogenase [Burkholderiaceae bacterium]